MTEARDGYFGIPYMAYRDVKPSQFTLPSQIYNNLPTSSVSHVRKGSSRKLQNNPVRFTLIRYCGVPPYNLRLIPRNCMPLEALMLDSGAITRNPDFRLPRCAGKNAMSCWHQVDLQPRDVKLWITSQKRI